VRIILLFLTLAFALLAFRAIMFNRASAPLASFTTKHASNLSIDQGRREAGGPVQSQVSLVDYRGGLNGGGALSRIKVRSASKTLS
jgi:hypothetical protein